MKEGVYNYIDLWLLSRFFRSYNLVFNIINYFFIT